MEDQVNCIFQISMNKIKELNILKKGVSFSGDQKFKIQLIDLHRSLLSFFRKCKGMKSFKYLSCNGAYFDWRNILTGLAEFAYDRIL